MNGPTRPPLGFPGDTAGPCGFAVAVDGDAARITLRGPVTGAGGGAYLTPVPGVELTFDRVGGWLSGMTVAVSEVTGVVPVEVVAWIASAFGTATALAIRDAPRGGTRWVTVWGRPRTLNALSRLARLEAARATSPVPASPLWRGEAADLARRAGLPPGRPEAGGWEAGAREAGRPVPSQTWSGQSLTGRPVPIQSRPGQSWPAVAASGGGGPAIPADVMRLLADDAAWALAGPRQLWDGLAQAAWPGTGRPPGGWLDLGLVPHGVFLPGLWPGGDLTVRAHQDGAPLIAVEVAVAPGVSPADLAGCRARLADAACRRVLATAPLRVCAPTPASAGGQVGAGPWARSELPAPSGLRALVRSGVAWADSIGLRRVRRALRWADAALRAESRPHGLATELTDEQWARLAALAWDRCRADWEAAGDPVRAALAATRGGSLGGGTACRGTTGSETAGGGTTGSETACRGTTGSGTAGGETAGGGPLPFLAELAGASGDRS